jgi:hypothetical protein
LKLNQLINNENENMDQMRSESNLNTSLSKIEITSTSSHKVSVLESMHELYNKLSPNDSNKSIDNKESRPHLMAMIVKSMQDINQKVDEVFNILFINLKTKLKI